MADTLDFENILKIIKENNPKSIELWQNRKISGAKTLFNSPYKHKIVDEVRFKLKGGVQIAFIGDDEQEKLIKIVGGRDKAQKTLNYIKKCSAENSENLSDEDKVLLDILNTSLKKYIKLLEIKQKEREKKEAEKLAVPSVKDMTDSLIDISFSEKTEFEKNKEKEKYLQNMKQTYQMAYDELKYKLAGIKVKINKKELTISNAKNQNTAKATLSKLYGEFKSLNSYVPNYNQGLEFINKSLSEIQEALKEEVSPIVTSENFDDSGLPKTSLPKKTKDSSGIIWEDTLSDIEPLSTTYTQFTHMVVNGKIAYNFGNIIQKYLMKKAALQIDMKNKKRRILLQIPFIQNIISFLPNKNLRQSAIEKLSSEEIALNNIFDNICIIGEIRQLSQKKYVSRHKSISRPNRPTSIDFRELDKSLSDSTPANNISKKEKRTMDLPEELEYIFPENTDSSKDDFFDLFI